MMQRRRIIHIGGGSHSVPYQPAELYVVASGTWTFALTQPLTITYHFRIRTDIEAAMQEIRAILSGECLQYCLIAVLTMPLTFTKISAAIIKALAKNTMTNLHRHYLGLWYSTHSYLV